MVSICSDKKAAAIFQFKIYLLRERERVYYHEYQLIMNLQHVSKSDSDFIFDWNYLEQLVELLKV